MLAKYEPQNVFSFDETELVYCAILDENIVCAEEDYDGRKKSKERIITIELTMSRADEKLRLLVIDKSPKLRQTTNLPKLFYTSVCCLSCYCDCAYT